MFIKCPFQRVLNLFRSSLLTRAMVRERERERERGDEGCYFAHILSAHTIGLIALLYNYSPQTAIEFHTMHFTYFIYCNHPLPTLLVHLRIHHVHIFIPGV